MDRESLQLLHRFLKPFQRVIFVNKIPDQLQNKSNLSVLNFLGGTSSHGDLSEFFHKTVERLDRADLFTPADRPFSYYLVYTNKIVFGFCESMTFVTYLLPKQFHEEATRNGGIPHPTLGKLGWYDFPVFGADSNLNHKRWAELAYQNVSC